MMMMILSIDNKEIIFACIEEVVLKVELVFQGHSPIYNTYGDELFNDGCQRKNQML